MRALRSESGQVIPFFAIVLLGLLLGVAALVLDVGAWLGSSRQAQAIADAAALAAAQDLPGDPSQAVADATSYAKTNGGTLADATVATTAQPNDTITVTVTKPAPIFLAGLFGVSSATAHGHATARASGAGTVPGTSTLAGRAGQPVPFVIPAAKAPPLCGCAYGQTVTLPVTGSTPGNFGLISFDGSVASPPTIGSWIATGYPGTVAPGLYRGRPGNLLGNKFIAGPMTALAGTTVLLAVTTDAYDPGANATYTVVGWAAFRLASYADGVLTGSFQQLRIPGSGSGGQDFGVGAVTLTG